MTRKPMSTGTWEVTTRYAISIAFGLAFLLAGPVLALGPKPPTNTPPAPLKDVLLPLLWTTFAAGGFGGFVHGLLRQTAVRYEIRLPFVKTASPDAGFLGDIVVGIAAAVTLFLVLDSVFLLNIQDLADSAKNNFHMWLKFIAVGVIGGYIGPGILDTMAVAYSKKLTQGQTDLEKMKVELEKARTQIEINEKVTELLILARAFRSWRFWSHALEYYDMAIEMQPDNPDNYVQKSFVYAGQAEEASDKKLDPAPYYYQAIELSEKAIEVGNKINIPFGRAYYDRACYRNKSKTAALPNILADLKKAIDLDAVHRKLAQHDPDFNDIREKEEEFKKLVPPEAAERQAPISSPQPAVSVH